MTLADGQSIRDQALELVEDVQETFVGELESMQREFDGRSAAFQRVEWQRDGGRHGGGHRYVAVETPVFHRAAVNVSSIYYDDDPSRKLASATALSTIIHPAHPCAPSVHMHVSWTQPKSASGYARIMADLNPSLDSPKATQQFAEALQGACPHYYKEASKEGDAYFFIPALKRHRGSTHFYLESFSTGAATQDLALARRVAMAGVGAYVRILAETLQQAPDVTEEMRAEQLAYHTVYLFQVLTLDRGTTSGLLVHNQNDLGIMGSLPPYVDGTLLSSWAALVPKPQDQLVCALVDILGTERRCHVTDEVRLQLAETVRQHYQRSPEALDLQAKGHIVPPTVANHRH